MALKLDYVVNGAKIVDSYARISSVKFQNSALDDKIIYVSVMFYANEQYRQSHPGNFLYSKVYDFVYDGDSSINYCYAKIKQLADFSEAVDV